MADTTATPRRTPAHPPLHTVAEELGTALNTLLEHGTQEDLLTAMSEVEQTINCLQYYQAALAHQTEKLIVLDHEERGIHMDRPTTGAASTVALARQHSPNAYPGKLLGYRILFEDTPHLAHAFALGQFNAERIDIIMAELRHIDATHRQAFDQLFATTPTLFENQGNNQVRDTVKQFTLPLRADDEAINHQTAADKQHIRFYKDGNTIRFSGSLPLALGIPLRQHLREGSFDAKRHGDTRTRTQIEASLLIGNLVAGNQRKLPITINLGLIMTERTLFHGDRDAAFLEGYGYISSQIARELIAGAFTGDEPDIRKMREGDYEDYLDHLETVTEIVRFYTAPGDTDLIAMDSKARLFPKKLKHFIRVRDRNCRTPYCDGWVQEADHILQHSRQGATDADNGSGKCRICNAAKEKYRWQEYVALAHPHTMVINNAGIHLVSTAPPASGYTHAQFPQLIQDASWVRQFSARLKNNKAA